MITEKDTEDIERYLSEELSAEERAVFESKIKENVELQKELVLHQGIRDAVNDTKAIELDESLREIGNTWKKENEPAIHHPFWTQTSFKIAATITLLAIVSFLIYFYLQPAFDNTQELFTHYYNAPTAETVRGTGPDEATRLQDALVNYRNGAYRQAVSDFEKILTMQPDYIKPKYYLAHCYLNVGETARAIDLFKSIIDHGDNIYISESHWYLGLAYVQKGEIDLAQSQFKTLPLNTKKGKEASKVLTDLELLE